MVDVKGGRILVIDSDAPSRHARASTLRDAGHTVFETARLADAAILVRQIRPELLVLGGNFHNGSDTDFSRTLAQDDDLRGTMLLRVSENGSAREDESREDRDDREDQARGLDADAYLAEPVPAGVLVDTAGVLLRLSRAERALRDSIALEQTARVEADAANRVKDDFLATLSHELRTPLHAIVGWVALLRRRPFDDAARAHALEVIERNAKAQTALIEDLLDVSRITLGQLQLIWGPVEIAPVLFATIDAIRPTAEAKGVTIEADIALDPGLSVRGDATRLRQVFWILLSNAVKFTPSGGHVGVRVHRLDGRVKIEVTDTGRGISAEFLAHMFERFHRADGGTTTVHHGLGLGLAIAQQLVELHAGTLSAASAGLDRGATFVVSLPHLTMRGKTITRGHTLTPTPTPTPRHSHHSDQSRSRTN
jgi:signal transduction histidine kinase